MSKLPSFLRQEKNSIYFNRTGELVYYVPEYYFESEIAIINGQDVSLLGMFDYAIFDDSGKNINGLKGFNYPTIFICRPGSIEKKKDLKLTKNSKIEDYRLLKFKKDDMCIVSTKVPMLIQNVEEFFRLFKNGRFPNSIPYDKIHEYFFDTMTYNSGSYGVSSQLFGLMIREMFRSQSNIDIPFILSNSNDMTEYTIIGIKDLPKMTSPYTAIASENFDESVVNAIINKNHKETPLEKLFLL